MQYNEIEYFKLNLINIFNADLISDFEKAPN